MYCVYLFLVIWQSLSTYFFSTLLIDMLKKIIIILIIYLCLSQKVPNLHPGHPHIVVVIMFMQTVSYWGLMGIYGWSRTKCMDDMKITYLDQQALDSFSQACEGISASRHLSMICSSLQPWFSYCIEWNWLEHADMNKIHQSPSSQLSFNGSCGFLLGSFIHTSACVWFIRCRPWKIQ